MATLSRSRVAGVTLAALFALTACGGGGGGGSTPPPPPPPVDTTPPTFVWKPIDGVTLDQGTITVTATANEGIGCPNTNPIVFTVNGTQVKPKNLDCTSPTLSLTFEVECGKVYGATLPKGSVKDNAGNALAADSKVTYQTKACPVKTPIVVTANNGAKTSDPRYTSLINTKTGVSQDVVLDGSELGATLVAVDSEKAQAYYALPISGRGCAYTMNLATHAVNCLKVNPAGSSQGHTMAVAVANQGVYFATSSEFSDQPGNLVLVFDRDNLGTKLATVALPNAAYSPLYMTADRDHNRVYVLSYDKASLVFNPWPDYLPGFGGKVYEIDTTTNALVRTFDVGSAPSGAAIDMTKKLLYVSNWGDRTISIVNLTTGSVRTVNLPSFFAEDDKYFQRPVGIALVGTKLFIANSKFAKGAPTDQVGGVAVLDLASETVTKTIPVGDIPYYLVKVGDDLWVTTGNTASGQYAVVQISTVTLTTLGSVAVGPSPMGIDVYAP